MTRGEVYYIKSSRLENGVKQMPDCPAVIVSSDMLNAINTNVKVCYMTVNPVNDMPTHVTTRSTGCVSTIMCESLNNVHISRIGSKAGELTEAEMRAMDAALAISLGIDFGDAEPRIVEKPVQKIVEKVVVREPTREELEAKARELMDELRTVEGVTISMPDDDALEELRKKSVGIMRISGSDDALKSIEVETMLDICKRDLLRAETERDIYRELYGDMLNTLTVLAKGEKA